MFIMFLDCAFRVLVAPPTLAIKLWLEKYFHILDYFKQQAGSGSASYYAKRLSISRLP